MSMRNPLEVGQKLLLAFVGRQITSEMKAELEKYRPGGITLFRAFNIETPAQLREFTDSLQQYAKTIGLPPLLIAADQEGGQLMAIGKGTTPLPGNMALGAAGSIELARKAGEVLGSELATMGVNVNYAPCCDVNVNPRNPVIGIRSFGENSQEVAKLSAAMVEGIQSQGVAAVAKHFPGHGDTISDSHCGLPSVPNSIERLREVEFPPFRAAIETGVKMVMSAHLSLPAIDGPDAPPATLSPRILQGLLRDELGFDGVIVSDAMDMRAIQQGNHLGSECARAALAGIDLLLITADPEDHRKAFLGLIMATKTDDSAVETMKQSIQRIAGLKNWLAATASQPGLDVIASTSHLAVAREIAERSITLVRDEQDLLPIRLNPKQKIAVIIPKPANLTPADTSSSIKPDLAGALRQYHPTVEEVMIPHDPGEEDIQNSLRQVQDADLVLCGTFNAFQSEGQARLVNSLIESGKPTIVAALRLPYDLTAFPKAGTYLCTYGILEPSLNALAAVLFGKIKSQGHLPVSIPGYYPVGYLQN